MRSWYAKNRIAERKKRRNRPSEQKEARAAQRRTDGAQAATKAYTVKYSESAEGRARYLFLGAKRRAAETNREFAICFEYVLIAVRGGRCARTGLEFDLSKRGGGKRHPLAPSVDRIDSTKGYTPDNTEVVCWMYNVCKSDFDLHYVQLMVAALATRL